MNYYEVLEVMPSASDEVIRMAYKALSKQYHPDVYAGNKKFAEDMMKSINEAYNTLSDSIKRAAYDESLNGKGHSQEKAPGGTAPPKDEAEPKSETKSESSVSEVVTPQRKSGVPFAVALIFSAIAHLIALAVGLASLAAAIFLAYIVFTGQLGTYWEKATNYVTTTYDNIVIELTKDKALNNPESPEGVSATYIHNIKTGNAEGARKVLNNPELDSYTGKLFEIYEGDNHLATYFGRNVFTPILKFESKVSDAEYTGETARVTVKLKVVDLSKVLLSTFVKMLKKIDNLSDEQVLQYTIESYDSELGVVLFPDIASKSYGEAFRENKSFVEEDIVFTLTKSNGEWRITDVDDKVALYDALTGNVRHLDDEEGLVAGIKLFEGLDEAN